MLLIPLALSAYPNSQGTQRELIAFVVATVIGFIRNETSRAEADNILMSLAT